MACEGVCSPNSLESIERVFSQGFSRRRDLTGPAPPFRDNALRRAKTHARYARIHTPTNRHTLLEAGPTLGRTNGEPLHRLHPTYTGHLTQKTLPTRVSESIIVIENVAVLDHVEVGDVGERMLPVVNPSAAQP